MTAPTTTPEIARYRDAVRAALADLSAEDRDDLMEDVESHLTEVAAENDGSLARLGSPADYAAELRTSAGLPLQSGPVVRVSFGARLSATLADSVAGRGVERITATNWWRSFRGFLPELRPGWWVLRGYLIALLINAVLGFSQSGGMPQPGNSTLLGLVLIGVAIWASVRLGRYAQTHRSVRPWVIAGTTLMFFFFVFIGVNSGSPPYETTSGWQETGLVGISNIYVFDSEGQPLTRVQLFDQDGNPLHTYGDAFDMYGNPIRLRPYIDANGREVSNVYPRETTSGGGVGPGMTVPRIMPRGGPAAGPLSSASPSAAPSAGVPTPSATPTPR